MIKRYSIAVGVYQVAISADNTRTNITIPKDLKAKLEQLAREDGRSFNNLVIKILREYAENRL